jgi:hypothetical protein
MKMTFFGICVSLSGFLLLSKSIRLEMMGSQFSLLLGAVALILVIGGIIFIIRAGKPGVPRS